MRVLLIDEDPIFRAIVRKYHDRDLTNLELIDLDLRGASVSATLLEWQQFQVVLLGHGDNTFDWLKDLGSSAPFYLSCTSRKQVLKHSLHDHVRWERTRSCERESSRASVWRKSSAKLFLGHKVASQIGEGAMSRVFLAERELDHLTVVLKIIELDLVNHHAYVKRFVDETELVSELRNLHVVRVYEQGFTYDVGFMAMEFFLAAI